MATTLRSSPPPTPSSASGRTTRLTRETERKSAKLRAALEALADEHEGIFTEVRGRGLILGLQTTDAEVAGAITTEAFERGLIIETAGANDDVVKLLPPLIVSDEQIDRAMRIISDCVDAVVDQLGEELRAGAREVRS